MDAFNDRDPDSSQATQMIQELLERDPSPSKRNDSRSSALKTQNHHSKEISTDSLPSSRTSHAIPQYHFHGLASTQTQSEHYGEDDEPEEGSQKENIDATKPSKESPPLRPSSPQASSSRNVAAKFPYVEHQGGALASNERGTIKRATNVTFQSPRPKSGIAASPNKPTTRQSTYKATTQATSRYRHPPRPPTRTSSQDSFACEPENNEELFLSKADQFVVPLSELGRSSPAPELDTTTGGTSTSSGSMYAYSRSTRQPAPRSPPRGRVLVESTPSNSSQSQSQPSDNEQPTVSERIQEAQFPYQPQNQLAPEPMNADRDGSGTDESDHADAFQYSPPEIHPDLLATQPSADADIQATQPSTQPSTQPDDSHIPEERRAIPYNLFQSILQSSASRTSASNPSGPRSLVSMVPPENQYRYRQYGNPQNSTPLIQTGSRITNEHYPTPPIMQSDYQETQPSFPEAPPPRRGFPIKSFTATTTPSVPSPAPIDSMEEIIPDSEPTRLGKQTGPAKAIIPLARPVQKPVAGSTTRRKLDPMDEDVEMRAADEVDFEIEEDDEDDIPLAKAVAVAPPAKKPRGRPPGSGRKVVNSKGKNKEPPPTSQGKQKAPQQGPTKFAQKPAVTAAKLHGRSWETNVVPSSVPEQDVPQNTRGTRNRPMVITEPKMQPTQKRLQSRQSSRSTSNAPRSHQCEQDDDEDETRERDKDGDTELAEEDYQDTHEDDEAGQSRKRKRVDKASTAAGGTRAATAKRSKRVGATPVTRSNGKSLRSATSTGVRSTQSLGSRVFALWTQDAHYYPGIVHSTDNHSRYNVKFDDGTEGWVTIDDMRICDLHVGDDVLFGDRNRPAKVVNIDGQKDGFVKVNLDGKVQEKATHELRIAHKTILYAWADRKLTPQTVSTTVKPVKKQLSPSPSKMSMVSVPSVRGNRKEVLAKTGLIVTLSAANGSWEKEKGNVMNAVRNSGGFVVDELNTIIKMEGKFAASNNRWTIEKADVKWIGNEDIERLFLVADDPNQKPKYLIALALGIPCLSTLWLQDSVALGEEKEWFGYMLPQGYSAVLKARPSQQVDVDWGNSVHQLLDIMNNTVACKLFAGKSILCVGADMVCHPKGKRKAATDEKALEASHAVPRIILAMGAEVVEAVTELRYTAKALANYDYVVIREPCQYVREFAQCTTVHWAWVKDCLIASRLLALPVWPQLLEEEDYSQET